MAVPTIAADPADAQQPAVAGQNHQIEGLRAVAALAVLVTHVSLNAIGNRGPWGGVLARLDVGVSIFFVLSGYLLYRPFAQALLRGEQRPSLRRYLRHRLVRIVPLYWVVVVVSFLFATGAGGALPTQGFSPETSTFTSVPLWTMARFATFTQVYWKDSLSGPFPQAWTLAVEMAFYLLLPALAWLLARSAPGDRRARLRRQWWALGTMVVVAQVWRFGLVLLAPAYRGTIGQDYTQLKAWLPNHLDLFALGMALAVLTVERADDGPGAALGDRMERLFSRRGAAAASWAASLGCLVLAGHGLGLSRTDLSYHRVGEFTRHWAYAGVAVFLVLPAIFGRGRGGPVRGLLASAPLRFLGKISYGIYLWQLVVLSRWVSAPWDPRPARHSGQMFNVGFWPTLAWTLVGTLVLSTLSWYLVERPWLRHRDRRLSRFAAGLWTISVASFAARIWAIATATKANPGNGDPFFYHAQANMLADRVGFGEPIQWLTEGRFVPTAIHPPLYTLWLYPSSLLGSRDFLSHKTMAVLAGVGVVVAIAFLVRRLAGDRAGLLAAALVALYPTLWIIDGTLWPEGLYTALVGLALVLAYRYHDHPSTPRALALGAAVGLAVLGRGEAIALWPLLCLPLAWSVRGRIGRWPVQALAMGLAAAVVISPWTIRNLTVFDEPVPISTNSQEVLFYANCPDVYDGPLIGYWSFGCQQREREARVARGETPDPPGDEAARASAWGKLGREYALSHKSRWPDVVVARVTRAWDLQHRDTNLSALQIEGRPREWSERGLWLYGALLLPAAAGLVVLRRRGELIWPLVAMVAMVTLTAAAVYGHVRFRTVGDFVIVAAAAVAIDALLSRWWPTDRTEPDPSRAT